MTICVTFCTAQGKSHVVNYSFGGAVFGNIRLGFVAGLAHLRHVPFLQAGSWSVQTAACRRAGRPGNLLNTGGGRRHGGRRGNGRTTAVEAQMGLALKDDTEDNHLQLSRMRKQRYRQERYEPPWPAAISLQSVRGVPGVGAQEREEESRGRSSREQAVTHRPARTR